MVSLVIKTRESHIVVQQRKPYSTIHPLLCDIPSRSAQWVRHYREWVCAKVGFRGVQTRWPQSKSIVLACQCRVCKILWQSDDDAARTAALETLAGPLTITLLKMRCTRVWPGAAETTLTSWSNYFQVQPREHQGFSPYQFWPELSDPIAI